MPTEFFEVDNPFVVAFAVDADLKFGETWQKEVTKRKIENSGTVSDFIADTPDTASLDGLVTAMAVNPLVPAVNKLTTKRDELKQLIDKNQVVLVLNDRFADYMAITRADVSESADEGKALRVSLALQKMELVTTGTTQVPASRLRSKVKRKAAAGKKGGAAKGSQPTTDDRSVLAKALDAGKINVPSL
jgi:hypothetical protein